jgi:hypothetical protein
MSFRHHIRLLGETHASHAQGAVLGVTENEAQAAASPHVVTYRHARDLVTRRLAEWVGLGAAEPPETHDERASRHGTEHADLLARHAREHRELMERHAEEHRLAVAGAGITAAVTGI